MGCEEQVRDEKCTRPSLPVEGLAPRLFNCGSCNLGCTSWITNVYKLYMCIVLILLFCLQLLTVFIDLARGDIIVVDQTYYSTVYLYALNMNQDYFVHCIELCDPLISFDSVALI